MEFRQREGRLRAAKNLIDRSITNLVVIGKSLPEIINKIFKLFNYKSFNLFDNIQLFDTKHKNPAEL
jgi:hypothetical protein